jgi:hypothetical protein
MHLVIYLPLLVPLAAAAPRPLAERLPPVAATWPRLPLALPRGAVTRHG